jgi:hypothetical protein
MRQGIRSSGKNEEATVRRQLPDAVGDQQDKQSAE